MVIFRLVMYTPYYCGALTYSMLARGTGVNVTSKETHMSSCRVNCLVMLVVIVEVGLNEIVSHSSERH